MVAKRAKPPAGCYWRGSILWAEAVVKGKRLRWSLETDDPKIARERRARGKEQAIAERHGDARHTVDSVLEEWGSWLKQEVGPKTRTRYLCSLDQLAGFLEGKHLDEVNSQLVADIIRARRIQGVKNATIKRDLVALSSVINFSIDQGWAEANPVLPRMRRVKERRHAIVLPKREHIDMVIEAAPGMIADLVRVAAATGAREDELLRARQDHVDRRRRQLTLHGKGERTRVIDLDPFGGFELVRRLPAFVGKPLMFWHGTGENYKNFASQFAAIVRRVEKAATAQGHEFRPFRFHDLRHLHAVEWLKDGRSIYDLQRRLGHSSIKVTEMYLVFLTPEEERIAKGLAAAAGPSAALVELRQG